MAVRATQLATITAKAGDFPRIVREHLEIIDAKLLAHERDWGHNCLPYELPITFQLFGKGNNDVRRLVYCTLIRSLEERGFKVNILLEPNRCVLYICWETELGGAELAEMNKKLKSCRITPNEAKGLMHGGRTHEGAAAGATPKAARRRQQPSRDAPPPSTKPSWATDAGSSGLPPPMLTAPDPGPAPKTEAAPA